jgi:hypothetical protein
MEHPTVTTQLEATLTLLANIRYARKTLAKDKRSSLSFSTASNEEKSLIELTPNQTFFFCLLLL